MMIETSDGQGDGQNEEKRCSRCDSGKPPEDFPFKSGNRAIRRVWCRACCRAYGREHYRANAKYYVDKARRSKNTSRLRIRALIADYLRCHPCVDCGRSDTEVLDFDHRDPSSKRASVSRLASTVGWATVQQEIAKCDVRCASCHRRRTARQFAWAKTLPSAVGTAGAHTSWAALVPPVGTTGMRTCSFCGQLKPDSSFSFRNVSTGALGDHCRTCQASYRKRHYQLNKAEYVRRAVEQMRRKRQDQVVRIRAYLSAHPCLECGEADILALDFDHTDATTKALAVGAMIGRRNWEAIEDEIAKCFVRCANCHRKRTARQRNAARRDPLAIQSRRLRE
jgi:hypothetical protein